MANAVAVPGVTRPEELDPFLPEAAPRVARRSWHCAALAIAAVATAGAVVTASKANRSDALAVWKGDKLGAHLAFLAEKKPALHHSEGVEAWRRYGDIVAGKVKKDEAVSVRMKEVAGMDFDQAQSVLALEKSEVLKGMDEVDKAKSMLAESQMEANAAQNIAKMSSKDVASAKSMREQAVKDIKQAQEMMASAPGGQGSSVYQLAQLQLMNAKSDKERAQQQLDMATQMSKQAASMMHKSRDMGTAEKVMNKTAHKEMASQESTIRLAEAELERSKSLTKQAEELMGVKASDEDWYAKVKKQTKNYTKDGESAGTDASFWEHVKKGKEGEVAAIKTASKEDDQAAEAIAEAAKGLAGLLAEHKSQAKNEVALVNSGSQEVAALLPEAAKPLQSMVKDESADAAIKQQQIAAGVEAIKEIASTAHDMQNSAEAEDKAAAKKAKKYGDEIQEMPLPASTGCCSFENSGICGKPDPWCDASEKNCLLCSKTAKFLNPKPAAPVPIEPAVPQAPPAAPVVPAGEVHDCNKGGVNIWSVDKRAYCCKMFNNGCPVQTRVMLAKK